MYWRNSKYLLTFNVYRTSSGTNEAEQQTTFGTPESHVWKLQVSPSSDGMGRMFAINTVTGEVRKYARGWPNSNRDRKKGVGKSFITYEAYGVLDLD